MCTSRPLVRSTSMILNNNRVTQAATTSLTRARVEAGFQRAKAAGELQFHSASLST
jgi:hypothetical protein